MLKYFKYRTSSVCPVDGGRFSAPPQEKEAVLAVGRHGRDRVRAPRAASSGGQTGERLLQDVGAAAAGQSRPHLPLEEVLWLGQSPMTGEMIDAGTQRALATSPWPTSTMRCRWWTTSTSRSAERSGVSWRGFANSTASLEAAAVFLLRPHSSFGPLHRSSEGLIEILRSTRTSTTSTYLRQRSLGYFLHGVL